MLDLSFLRGGARIYLTYPKKETVVDYCFSFLKTNLLENHEVILIMMANIDKDRIRSKIAKDWNISIETEKMLEIRGDLIITMPEEWYQPDGNFDTSKILDRWEFIISEAKRRGRKGIRAFVDADDFLRERLDSALLLYYEILESHFSFPFTCVYALREDNLGKMTLQQLALLNKSHGLVWFNFHDVRDSPFKNHFICLMEKNSAMANPGNNEGVRDWADEGGEDNEFQYDGQDNKEPMVISEESHEMVSATGPGVKEQRLPQDVAGKDEKVKRHKERDAEVIARLINHGLSKGDLCVVMSMNIRDKDWVPGHLAKRIKKYPENVNDEKIWFLDTSSFYVSALCQDFKPFEQFKEQLKKRLDSIHGQVNTNTDNSFHSQDSIIISSSSMPKACFVSDCAGTLFKNRHFEQCYALEQWWINNLPKNVYRLSLYPAYLFGKLPYKYNTNLIISNESMSLLLP
jgi:hypothetical protein